MEEAGALIETSRSLSASDTSSVILEIRIPTLSNFTIVKAGRTSMS